MTVFLETERLTLREFTPDDVDILLALDQDPRVRTYVEDGVPVTREEAQITIEHFLAYYERGEVFGFWAAIERETGGFLGWFHLRPDDRSNITEPELGYRLIASCWGKGFGTEGSRALIDHGFAHPQVKRVVASTMAVNTASRRVMEKAGMRLVRTFHMDWPVRIAGDERATSSTPSPATNGRPSGRRGTASHPEAPAKSPCSRTRTPADPSS